MGGNVAWTIRKTDGTEFRMDRWTNIFGGGLTSVINDAFLAGDEDAFAEAMDQWVQMKADWEANKDTGKYQHNMTEVFAPYPFGLRPSQYGFIVTDFVSKTIVSCQNYTSFGQMHLVSWQMENDSEKIQCVTELAQQGRLLAYLDEETLTYKPFPVTEPEQVLAFIRKHRFFQFTFSYLDGWKAEEYESDTAEGRQQAFDRVLELGFALDKSEMRDFKKWIGKRKKRTRK